MVVEQAVHLALGKSFFLWFVMCGSKVLTRDSGMPDMAAMMRQMMGGGGGAGQPPR